MGSVSCCCTPYPCTIGCVVFVKFVYSHVGKGKKLAVKNTPPLSLSMAAHAPLLGSFSVAEAARKGAGSVLLVISGMILTVATTASTELALSVKPANAIVTSKTTRKYFEPNTFRSTFGQAS